MLTTSLSQLKMVQGKLQESQESLSSINTESKSKEILVPLTGSVSFSIYIYTDWQSERFRALCNTDVVARMLFLHYQHLGIINHNVDTNLNKIAFQ